MHSAIAHQPPNLNSLWSKNSSKDLTWGLIRLGQATEALPYSQPQRVCARGDTEINPGIGNWHGSQVSNATWHPTTLSLCSETGWSEQRIESKPLLSSNSGNLI